MADGWRGAAWRAVVVVVAAGIAVVTAHRSCPGERVGGSSDERNHRAPRAWSSPQAAARALPSGLRRLAAAWFWVRARRAWERQSAWELRHALAWTVALRPEQRDYWIDGARMLACDVPQWTGGAWPERRRAIEEALRFLAEAENVHPMAFVIPLEIGWLRGWELGDLEGAERALARAARLAPFPLRAVRLRVRVLERLGRTDDAREAWQDALRRERQRATGIRPEGAPGP